MAKDKKLKDGGTRIITKPSFGSPFCVSWPEIGKHENKRIIDEIKSELPKFVEGRRLKRQKEDVKTSDGLEDGQFKRWSYRDVILVGINAVTKALETGPLSLVLVCKSGKPAIMTHHLIPLCAMQHTPGCCISGLNGAVSLALDLKSVLAVGFKIKEENPLCDLIEFIGDKAPSLDIPWLKVWTGNHEKIKANETFPSADSSLNPIDMQGSNQHESAQTQLRTVGKSLPLIENDDHNEVRFKSNEKSNKRRTSTETEVISKRKFNDVAYKLIETNYKMVEVAFKKKS